MPFDPRTLAGQRYYPSNGTGGMDFMETWCARCLREADGAECQILSTSFFEEVPEWVYDQEGRPTCTAFAEDTEANRAALYRERVEALGQQRLPGLPNGGNDDKLCVKENQDGS